jgi:hypothetical protein
MYNNFICNYIKIERKKNDGIKKREGKQWMCPNEFV